MCSYRFHNHYVLKRIMFTNIFKCIIPRITLYNPILHIFCLYSEYFVIIYYIWCKYLSLLSMFKIVVHTCSMYWSFTHQSKFLNNLAINLILIISINIIWMVLNVGRWRQSKNGKIKVFNIF